jgi:hypothetical protein
MELSCQLFVKFSTVINTKLMSLTFVLGFKNITSVYSNRLCVPCRPNIKVSIMRVHMLHNIFGKLWHKEAEKEAKFFGPITGRKIEKLSLACLGTFLSHMHPSLALLTKLTITSK